MTRGTGRVGGSSKSTLTIILRGITFNLHEIFPDIAYLFTAYHEGATQGQINLVEALRKYVIAKRLSSTKDV